MGASRKSTFCHKGRGRAWEGTKRRSDMALTACLQVTPLWSLCGVTGTRVPQTQHLSSSVCVHTQFRWGSAPPEVGLSASLIVTLLVRVSSALSCLCPRALSGPWTRQAHCQDGHREERSLPPQGEGGRVGCGGVCAHVSAHVRPEDNVGRLLLSLSKLSLETGSFSEPRAPKSSRLLRSVWLCPDGVMRE